MEAVRVHPRVHMRHPEISSADVLSAWKNAVALIERRTEEKDFLVALGLDGKGRLIEMISAREDDGAMMVFHAMTPPTKKTLRELGLVER